MGAAGSHASCAGEDAAQAALQGGRLAEALERISCATLQPAYAEVSAERLRRRLELLAAMVSYGPPREQLEHAAELLRQLEQRAAEVQGRDCGLLADCWLARAEALIALGRTGAAQEVNAAAHSAWFFWAGSCRSMRAQFQETRIEAAHIWDGGDEDGALAVTLEAIDAAVQLAGRGELPVPELWRLRRLAAGFHSRRGNHAGAAKQLGLGFIEQYGGGSEFDALGFAVACQELAAAYRSAGLHRRAAAALRAAAEVAPPVLAWDAVPATDRGAPSADVPPELLWGVQLVLDYVVDTHGGSRRSAAGECCGGAGDELDQERDAAHNPRQTLSPAAAERAAAQGAAGRGAAGAGCQRGAAEGVVGPQTERAESTESTESRTPEQCTAPDQVRGPSAASAEVSLGKHTLREPMGQREQARPDERELRPPKELRELQGREPRQQDQEAEQSGVDPAAGWAAQQQGAPAEAARCGAAQLQGEREQSALLRERLGAAELRVQAVSAERDAAREWAARSEAEAAALRTAAASARVDSPGVDHCSATRQLKEDISAARAEVAETARQAEAFLQGLHERRERDRPAERQRQLELERQEEQLLRRERELEQLRQQQERSGSLPEPWRERFERHGAELLQAQRAAGLGAPVQGGPLPDDPEHAPRPAARDGPRPELGPPAEEPEAEEPEAEEPEAEGEPEAGAAPVAAAEGDEGGAAEPQVRQLRAQLAAQAAMIAALQNELADCRQNGDDMLELAQQAAQHAAGAAQLESRQAAQQALEREAQLRRALAAAEAEGRVREAAPAAREGPLQRDAGTQTARAAPAGALQMGERLAKAEEERARAERRLAVLREDLELATDSERDKDAEIGRLLKQLRSARSALQQLQPAARAEAGAQCELLLPQPGGGEGWSGGSPQAPQQPGAAWRGSPPLAAELEVEQIAAEELGAEQLGAEELGELPPLPKRPYSPPQPRAQKRWLGVPPEELPPLKPRPAQPPAWKQRAGSLPPAPSGPLCAPRVARCRLNARLGRGVAAAEEEAAVQAEEQVANEQVEEKVEDELAVKEPVGVEQVAEEQSEACGGRMGGAERIPAELRGPRAGDEQRQRLVAAECAAASEQLRGASTESCSAQLTAPAEGPAGEERESAQRSLPRGAAAAGLRRVSAGVQSAARGAAVVKGERGARGRIRGSEWGEFQRLAAAERRGRHSAAAAAGRREAAAAAAERRAAEAAERNEVARRGAEARRRAEVAATEEGRRLELRCREARQRAALLERLSQLQARRAQGAE